MNAFNRISFLAFSFMLAGCPQGSANDVFRRDGGDDGGDAEAGVASSNDATGSGALCGAGGKDECGSLAICDAKLGCVECRTDDDCPITAARCLVGACVGCRPGMTDCQPGLACSTADFECHPRCVGPGSCGEGMVCDESSGECVGCLGAEGCAGRVCSAQKRQCVECASDESCPKGKPRCRVLTGECARCLSDDDCGVTAPICDPFSFACRRPDAGAPGPSDAGLDGD